MPPRGSDLWMSDGVCVERRDHRRLHLRAETPPPGLPAPAHLRRRRHPRAPTLFLSDDGDDVGVATFGGNRQRARRVAVRPDALARVGTVLHQEANHFRPSLQYSMVEGPMLVVLRHIDVDQLRTHGEHRPHTIDVAGAHGVAESADRYAIDERLQFGPTVEAVGSREHELRVVQREASRGSLPGSGRRPPPTASASPAANACSNSFAWRLSWTEIRFVAQRASGRVFP